MMHLHREEKMKVLTKEEREFIYAIMNQVAVKGIEANQLKVDVMKKMDVEPDPPEEKKLSA